MLRPLCRLPGFSAWNPFNLPPAATFSPRTPCFLPTSPPTRWESTPSLPIRRYCRSPQHRGRRERSGSDSGLRYISSPDSTITVTVNQSTLLIVGEITAKSRSSRPNPFTSNERLASRGSCAAGYRSCSGGDGDVGRPKVARTVAFVRGQGKRQVGAALINPGKGSDRSSQRPTRWVWLPRLSLPRFLHDEEIR